LTLLLELVGVVGIMEASAGASENLVIG